MGLDFTQIKFDWPLERRPREGETLVNKLGFFAAHLYDRLGNFP